MAAVGLSLLNATIAYHTACLRLTLHAILHPKLLMYTTKLCCSSCSTFQLKVLL